MSLRRDIHAAIDEVAPPVPTFPGQVARFVLADKDTQREFVRARRGVRTPFYRGAFSMVAATLIVVLMAAVVVGPRVWREWDTLVGRPRIYQAELKKLEAKPLELPTMAADGTCPVGPFTPAPSKAHIGPVDLIGLGPVYIAGVSGKDAQAMQTSWGTYLFVYFTVPAGYSGLVLIRARDLKTNQPVVFARNLRDQSAAGTGAGDQVGTDVLYERQVQQFTEYALDARKLRANLPSWWPYDDSTQGFPRGSSLCIGYQVDGSGFRETFVANYG